VFSINCYMERVPADKLRPLSEKLGMPILIGEWHFGALDVGLPASGIGRVANQEERGKAFRVYLETAAAETLVRRCSLFHPLRPVSHWQISMAKTTTSASWMCATAHMSR
jgi:hypothetical protein